jgi:hypothetical protein
MGVVLRRVWHGVLCLWTIVWLLAFFIFRQDNPQSLQQTGFFHIWLLVVAPWAATLLVSVVLSLIRYGRRRRPPRGIRIVSETPVPAEGLKQFRK